MLYFQSWAILDSPCPSFCHCNFLCNIVIIWVVFNIFRTNWQAETKNVLLSRAISLKVNYEKVKFSNFVFTITLVIMNGHMCKLFKNVIHDVQNKGNGEKNTA